MIYYVILFANNILKIAHLTIIIQVDTKHLGQNITIVVQANRLPGETKTSIDDDSVFGAEQVQFPESSLSTLLIISLEWVFGPGAV